MTYGFFMKYFKIFLFSIFCVLLVSCSSILERRNVKIELLSESETEIVFSGSCSESAKVVENIDVLYPNDETAIVVATVTLASFANEDLKGDFIIKVKNNPKLRFVLFGTKKHIIWIKNK